MYERSLAQPAEFWADMATDLGLYFKQQVGTGVRSATVSPRSARGRSHSLGTVTMPVVFRVPTRLDHALAHPSPQSSWAAVIKRQAATPSDAIGSRKLASDLPRLLITHRRLCRGCAVASGPHVGELRHAEGPHSGPVVPRRQDQRLLQRPRPLGRRRPRPAGPLAFRPHLSAVRNERCHTVPLCRLSSRADDINKWTLWLLMALHDVKRQGVLEKMCA